MTLNLVNESCPLYNIVCPFCEHKKFIFECKYPDSNDKIINILSCHTCGAFIPDYSKRAFTTSEQTRFHEIMWGDDSYDDWIEAKNGMVGMVEKQSWLLGNPNCNHLVLDIGAGRGNLTAALSEHGFDYLSCEPSQKLRKKAIDRYNIPPEKIVNTGATEFIKLVNEKHIHNKTEVSIYLWHVLEHIQNSFEILKLVVELFKDKTINLFIQMPMLKSSYIFLEHYFLATPDWFYYISKVTGLKLVSYSWSRKNLFMTGIYSNNDSIPEFELKRPFKSLTQFERLTYLISQS
jgi:2-polyprenyl-3-methyl-5-hydroxy-6-metoxy-1,4-benzoquinol methylase